MPRKPGIIEPANNTKHIFLGVHGDPGIGKTELEGTSPGKVLIIRSPQSHLNAIPPKRLAQIEKATVKDWDDMHELRSYLREDGHVYDWVWLDDAGSVFESLMDDIWDDTVKRKPSRAEFGLDQGEYGINMERFSRWMRHIVGADKFNFGYSAWSTVYKSPDLDQDGDPVEKLMPWVRGKGMPQMMCGYMNIVAYYHQAKIGGKRKRVLRTQSDDRYYAADKFGATGGRVIEPTMPKIIELVDKARGEQKPAKSTNKGASKVKRRVVRR
jgi:hypothetical protein